MAFSEKLKSDVRRQAAFRCCRCQDIGVEIHHIIPQAVGGSDEEDNAAPLCAKCHGDFGDNPAKRKEIREMRDWWYERVSVKFSGSDPKFFAMEGKLDELLLKQEQSSSDLEMIKQILSSYASNLIGEIDSNNARSVASSIVNIEKKPFMAGSPCQMSGQDCPACSDGVMDIDASQSGVECNKCRLFIPA